MSQAPNPQTKLLICGSRHTTSHMAHYADNSTAKAIANNWTVYCGDATGIDSFVATRFAKTFPTDDISSILNIIGISNTARHGIKDHSLIRYSMRLRRNGENRKEAFVRRDRYMVESVDKVMCIWNGKSKQSGTYLNYLYACELNKQAWLVNQYGKIIECNES